MDLVNIIYRYINRSINTEELIELLENIDKTKFLKDEIKEIEKLILEVKDIVYTTEIKIDQVEENRQATINRLIGLFEQNKDNEILDEEANELIGKTYNNLLKGKEKVRDSGPRYEKLFELLVNNSIYINYCRKMNDLELLEFITQYIWVPLPPNIEQKDFDDLVDAGIKEDKRESLWRLAMNYNRKGKDFSKIEDYFILKRDDDYLAELISSVEEDLDLDRLIDKVLETKDKDFIKKLANTTYLHHIFNEEQKEKVKNAIQ